MPINPCNPRANTHLQIVLQLCSHIIRCAKHKQYVVPWFPALFPARPSIGICWLTSGVQCPQLRRRVLIYLISRTDAVRTQIRHSSRLPAVFAYHSRRTQIYCHRRILHHRANCGYLCSATWLHRYNQIITYAWCTIYSDVCCPQWSWLIKQIQILLVYICRGFFFIID